MTNIDNINIDRIDNLGDVLNAQMEKLNNLRDMVKKLNFVPFDIMGDYEIISFKAIDGGRMKIYFDPLEIDIIDVFDSYGNLKLKFVVPSDLVNYDEHNPPDLSFLEENPIIKSFLKIFGKDRISEISEIYNSPDTLMEISEWACIYDKIINNSGDPVLIMRDGLLRTKKIKSELIKNLINILKEKSNSVWLVGIAKRSKIMNMLSTAMFMEKKIPKNQIGYIKIPKELELMAYKWSGRGRIDENINKIYYAFGDLYIAKLSRKSNLLVTVEIPKDLENDKDIYTERQIKKIFGHLAKDSKYSYPVLGYPQTLMKAHEYATNVGFPSSVIRDRILGKIYNQLDETGKSFMREAFLLRDEIDRSSLGGDS